LELNEAYPVVVQRVDLQHVKDILLWPALCLTLAPLGHLDTAQVVRSIDIAVLPFARHLSFVLYSLLCGRHCGLILSVSPEVSGSLLQKLVGFVSCDAGVL
jgi:hypothetical protein